MADSAERKAGDKMSLYCPDCREEQTFTWSAWSGEEFFGYPPKEEHGWQCTSCGCRLTDTR